MNKKVDSIKTVVMAVGLLASVAQAGVPLNGLQGPGGFVFNPLAYTVGSEANTDSIVGKPQVAAWFANFGDSSINWYAASAAISVAKVAEFSYGYGLIDMEPDPANTHNLGAKLCLIEENLDGTPWVPALAVGGVFMMTDADTDYDDSGVNAYVVATKTIKQTPVPFLVSAGLLYSDEIAYGIMGHNEADSVFFGNIAVMPVENITVGLEYKQGVDAGDDTAQVTDSDCIGGQVAWTYDANWTFVGAYADTGSTKKGKTDFGFGDSLMVSAQYTF